MDDEDTRVGNTIVVLSDEAIRHIDSHADNAFMYKNDIRAFDELVTHEILFDVWNWAGHQWGFTEFGLKVKQALDDAANMEQEQIAIPE